MANFSFDPVAKYYDLLASLVYGDTLKKAQDYYLSRIPDDSQVLIIGGGTGWIIEKILKKSHSREIIFLETSQAMLNLARKKYSKISSDYATKVTFVEGSINSVSPNQSFDAVVTFFVLDVYSDIENEALTRQLFEKLKKGGLWLFADFDPLQRVKTPYWQRFLLFVMYRFFRLTTGLKNQKIPSYHQHFEALNLRPVEHQFFFRGFIRSSLYQKMHV